jgi:hypothetical protein
MSKRWPIHGLLAPFKDAIGFLPDEPPLCFYLEERPLLAERFQISTPDLENVCLLNGIHFHVDDEFGCQMYIEDRPGLIAAVPAATTRNVEKPNFQAITRWRLYRTDDRSVSSL